MISVLPFPVERANDSPYCLNASHVEGDHDASCMPPADPADTHLRLLRVIFGLCADCDRADDHEHPCRVCGAAQPLADGSWCYHEEPAIAGPPRQLAIKPAGI